MSSKVLSFIAIFIALSGSSYAAIRLKPNSVTSPTVKDGSLLRRDFKTGVLPATTRVTASAGATGAAGLAGPQGEKGEKGEKGDSGPVGPSEAQSVYKYGPAGQITPAATTFAGLDLAPGAYLVEAKLAVAAVGPVAVTCELHAGQAKDEALATEGANTLNMHLTTTLAAAGTATLKCSASNAQLSLPAAGNIRLTAVRLGSETSTSL
jgi:hypothetical protein